MDKEKIYKDYISTHFEKAHPRDSQKDVDAQYRYFKKNYSKYLPPDKGAKILDLASGMGQFLNFLRRQGYENFLGVDISEQEIEYCKGKGYPVEKADMFAFLDAHIEAFDAIVFNNTIEHLTKEQALSILSKIHKSLKGNGVLLAKTVNMANFITASGGRYIDITHETGFTEESLRQVCSLSGFKDVKITGTDIYVFYLNPLNYVARFTAFIFGKLFRALFLLYGRKTTHIFTKDILAVCRKQGL
jgi:2-polyprenyl-3-methyl-5-hydroxy-6-metoxy-1,4-benzoquinol methylase